MPRKRHITETNLYIDRKTLRGQFFFKTGYFTLHRISVSTRILIIPTFLFSFYLYPSSCYRFQPSVVKKICDEILAAELANKTWNGEEEPLWAVRITEQIKTKVKGT